MVKHRTSIFIAHRLSTVVDADEIIVLDQVRAPLLLWGVHITIRVWFRDSVCPVWIVTLPPSCWKFCLWKWTMFENSSPSLVCVNVLYVVIFMPYCCMFLIRFFACFCHLKFPNVFPQFMLLSHCSVSVFHIHPFFLSVEGERTACSVSMQIELLQDCSPHYVKNLSTILCCTCTKVWLFPFCRLLF